MRFMQIESVLQTINRSEPAKNRFSVALESMFLTTAVMLILQYIEWLSCKRDVYVNTTDFDVEYKESETIFFSLGIVYLNGPMPKNVKMKFLTSQNRQTTQLSEP